MLEHPPTPQLALPVERGVRARGVFHHVKLARPRKVPDNRVAQAPTLPAYRRMIQRRSYSPESRPIGPQKILAKEQGEPDHWLQCDLWLCD